MESQKLMQKFLGGKTTRLICGYCKTEFQVYTKKGNHGYIEITCLGCFKTFPGSKIKLTGNSVGAKHIHTPYKDGDIL